MRGFIADAFLWAANYSSRRQRLRAVRALLAAERLISGLSNPRRKSSLVRQLPAGAPPAPVGPSFGAGNVTPGRPFSASRARFLSRRWL